MLNMSSLQSLTVSSSQKDYRRVRSILKEPTTYLPNGATYQAVKKDRKVTFKVSSAPEVTSSIASRVHQKDKKDEHCLETFTLRIKSQETHTKFNCHIREKVRN